MEEAKEQAEAEARETAEEKRLRLARDVLMKLDAEQRENVSSSRVVSCSDVCSLAFEFAPLPSSVGHRSLLATPTHSTQVAEGDTSVGQMIQLMSSLEQRHNSITARWALSIERYFIAVDSRAASLLNPNLSPWHLLQTAVLLLSCAERRGD